jgi:ketosteroid isomerase-like protein
MHRKEAHMSRPHVSAAAEELRDLESQWFDAIVRRDGPTLDLLVCPEFISINPDGTLSDKAAVVAGLPQLRSLDAIRNRDAQTTVLGDVAFVTGQSSYFSAGSPVGALRHSSLWVRRAGRWQVLAWQGTPLQPSSAAD